MLAVLSYITYRKCSFLQNVLNTIPWRNQVTNVSIYPVNKISLFQPNVNTVIFIDSMKNQMTSHHTSVSRVRCDLICSASICFTLLSSHISSVYLKSYRSDMVKLLYILWANRWKKVHLSIWQGTWAKRRKSRRGSELLLFKSWILRRGENSVVPEWGQGGKLQSRNWVIRRRKGVWVRERRRRRVLPARRLRKDELGWVRAWERGQVRERDRERDGSGWRKAERSWWRREEDEVMWLRRQWHTVHLALQRREGVNDCVTRWDEGIERQREREISIDLTVARTTLNYNCCCPDS